MNIDLDYPFGNSKDPNKLYCQQVVRWSTPIYGGPRVDNTCGGELKEAEWPCIMTKDRVSYKLYICTICNIITGEKNDL